MWTVAGQLWHVATLACLSSCRPRVLLSRVLLRLPLLLFPAPCICSLNFKDIVSLVNCAYCLGQLLQFVAFIWLRIK